MRKNLGKKNCELAEEDITRISDAFLAFKETEQSKIFPNKAFGYFRVTVERPLRLRVELTDEARHRFRITCADAKEAPLTDLMDRVTRGFGEGPYLDFNELRATIEECADKAGIKLTAKRMKLLQNTLAVRDEKATPVVKRTHKPGKAKADPLRGRYEALIEDKPAIVEYEPDTELRDSEQVPLLEEGGIEAFIRREVLPHASDAWFDEDSIKIGYEISFTRYFYKPQPLRTLEEIKADILAVEQETEGLLSEIIGEVPAEATRS